MLKTAHKKNLKIDNLKHAYYLLIFFPLGVWLLCWVLLCRVISFLFWFCPWIFGWQIRCWWPFFPVSKSYDLVFSVYMYLFMFCAFFFSLQMAPFGSVLLSRRMRVISDINRLRRWIFETTHSLPNKFIFPYKFMGAFTLPLFLFVLPISLARKNDWVNVYGVKCFDCRKIAILNCLAM